MTKRIAALIMAGGASSRFGGCKLLAEVGGRSLLRSRIDLAVELFGTDVYVVTGAWHDALMAEKAKGNLTGATFLFADKWADGLAASLATGITSLEGDYDAVLVLLADQVALTRNDLERLLRCFDGNNIACSLYMGKRGVPVIFGRNSFNRLKKLRGDQGAKTVLYDSNIPVTECSLPSAARDIDSRDELADWTQGGGTNQGYGEFPPRP